MRTITKENLDIVSVYKDEETVNKVVDIHLSTFSGFFLTFMGRGFLKQMYTSYCEHEESGLLVAFEGGVPVGFLAYSSNMGDLYRYMIKKRLPQFACYSIGAFFRKPKVFMRLIRAFLKPAEAKREERYVRLASIGVSKDVSSKGIGSRLIDRLKEIVDFDKYEYITLETDAEGNEAANNFYLKNRFEFVRMYETAEGRKLNEYQYKVK